MKNLEIETVKRVLKEFVIDTGESLELILIEELALQLYGQRDRAAVDIDAEVEKGDLFKLYEFLKKNGIPVDLSENISGWSVVAMPERYRERAKTVIKDTALFNFKNRLDMFIKELKEEKQS
ncbi:hypothetical protein [Persephonella sp.]